MSELLKINVNDHTERKNGLTYLSWAWAWAEVLKIDPNATWQPVNFGADAAGFQLLCKMDDGTAMVGVDVSIKGITRRCLLPVMDQKNKAVPHPDAFGVNKAQMRCLAKAIAMHGLGLYIYAGEDLPEADETAGNSVKPLRIPATVGAGDGLSAERKAELDDMALTIIDAGKQGRELHATELYYSIEDNDEKVYVWAQMKTESALRRFIKDHSPHKAQKAA